MKPVRVRPRANTEIDALADYIAQDSLDTALRFLDAVQKTFDLIGEQPGIGSPRYAHLPMLEGLRVWAIFGFENHLVFYIERPGYIDVLRVLHGARDIPTALMEDQTLPP
jgi:toxin ParE1/3/4